MPTEGFEVEGHSRYRAEMRKKIRKHIATCHALGALPKDGQAAWWMVMQKDSQEVCNERNRGATMKKKQLKCERAASAAVSDTGLSLYKAFLLVQHSNTSCGYCTNINQYLLRLCTHGGCITGMEIALALRRAADFRPVRHEAPNFVPGIGGFPPI